MLNTLAGIIASSGGAAAVASSYESIATVTLGSNASSVTLSSIPSTYQHLQVRIMARTDRPTVASGDWIKPTFNGDTGANYAFHEIRADGSTVATANSVSQNAMEIERTAGAGSITNGFGVLIFDLLDYANTSKYKTQRTLGGYDNNGAGVVGIYSGVWMNTNAVTSITFVPGGGTNFVQYSSFALYGIKG